MTASTPFSSPAAAGSCTLVGAGPGDPELLTLKAVRAIGAATVSTRRTASSHTFSTAEPETVTAAVVAHIAIAAIQTAGDPGRCLTAEDLVGEPRRPGGGSAWLTPDSEASLGSAAEVIGARTRTPERELPE